MPVTALDATSALIVVDLQKGLAGLLPAAAFDPVVERSAALANPGDAGIRLDRHHHVALIEERREIRRSVGPHPGDLHLGQSLCPQKPRSSYADAGGSRE